jgi:hypothetical protein
MRLLEGASEGERVQAAMVLWAKGDIARLRSSADLVHADWRDVLARGELADDGWREHLNAELGPETE